MSVYIVLLRAVNVGGTGKLPMAELKAMCEAEGFKKVKTYIASGNVVFETDTSAIGIKASLEKRLEAYAGKPVGVIVRTPKEMKMVLKGNPFPDAEPNRTVAIFFDDILPVDVLQDVKKRTSEEVIATDREIYAYYPDGMGQSKLVIPASKAGTARNMNTIGKLIEIAGNF